MMMIVLVGAIPIEIHEKSPMKRENKPNFLFVISFDLKFIYIPVNYFFFQWLKIYFNFFT